MQNLECLPLIPKERKTRAGVVGRLLNLCLSEYNNCAGKKIVEKLLNAVLFYYHTLLFGKPYKSIDVEENN